MILQWNMKNHQYYQNRNKGEYKIVKNVYPHCVLMEEPSHSFNTWSWLENFSIAFQISLVFVAHSIQNNQFFLIFKRDVSLSLWTFFLLCLGNNSLGYYCLAILEAIDQFWCNFAVWFSSKCLEHNLMWRGAILDKNSIFLQICFIGKRK